MIIPPATPEYDVGSQAAFNDVVEQADGQNFKLDQDNFLTTGSVCLQNVEGDWFKLGIRSSATGYAVITVGTISDNGDHADEAELFRNVSLGGGTGTGVLASVQMNDDFSIMPNGVTITSGGSGYTLSDTLTIPNSIIGGAVNATCVVNQIGTNSEPILTITKLTGTQLDADGRPAIASTNPYIP